MNSKRLGEQSAEREESEDQHRQHTTRIRVHALLLNEQLRQVATEDRDDRNDQVQSEDQSLTFKRGRRSVKLVAEI